MNVQKTNILAALSIVLFFISCAEHPEGRSEREKRDYINIIDVKRLSLDGILGNALEISKNGRLSHFITNPESKAVKMFTPGNREDAGWRGWMGEHAGKWLYAATKAAYRSNDDSLKQKVHEIADFLISVKCKNGYIGSYIDSIRFYANPINPQKSWDVWNSAYLMQGFMEMYKVWHEEKYLNVTKGMANLIINTFGENKKSLANSGYYDGLAANGIVEQFTALYNYTNEDKYLRFATYCVKDLEQRPGTEIISRGLCKYDVAQIDHGKMYEMIRVYVGLAKLYQTTGNDTLLNVINNAWNEIHDFHLSPLGAPWGGIHENGQHLECFNVRYLFSPYGYSETCAIMEWFRLTKEMFRITGEIKYANELEKTAYNGVLGAQFPDGFTWTYHSRPNGERTKCGPFACCSSSGPIVLEEIPEVIYTLKGDDLMINIFAKSSISFNRKGENIAVEQLTNYPWDGDVKIKVKKQTDRAVNVYVRIPEWAEGTTIVYADETITSQGNEYVKLRVKGKDALISVFMPTEWRVHRKTQKYDFKGDYLFHNKEYFYLKRGAIVYAASITDDLDNNTSLRFSPLNIFQNIKAANDESGGIPQFSINGSIPLKPFFTAADRTPGNYKATWLRIK